MGNKFNPADFVNAAQIDGIAAAVQAEIDSLKNEGRTSICERRLMPAFSAAFKAANIDMTDAYGYGEHDKIKYYVWEKVKPKLVGADI